MTIEFRDTNGGYIKQWSNWDEGIPQKDDIVLLHYGDYGETEVKYIVKQRIISGTNYGKIVLLVEKL